MTKLNPRGARPGVRDFAFHLARQERMVTGLASRFHRSSLDDEDIRQEAMIMMWEALQRPAKAERHVAAGQLTVADIPDEDLDPLLYRSIRSRLVTLVRREEAQRRDYRCRVPLEDAPETEDVGASIEAVLVAHQDFEQETTEVDRIMGIAFRLMTDDEAVVAFELLYPRPAECVPGAAGRKIDPRSTYSIAAIFGWTRDRARTVLLNVRAKFAVAGGYVERDWCTLVRA